MTGRDPTGDGLEPGIAPARVETVELEGPDTGLRDAEEAIEGWQDQIRLLFECSHDPILVLNGSSRFVDCNSAAQEVFGVPSKGLIIMKTPAEISPEYQPDGSSSAAKAFRMIEAAKERGTVQFQWTHLRPDGTQFAMEVSLSAISPGKKEALLYWRDSGCLTRVDEVVRKSEARLRQVIDLVPHFIFAKDRSGRFVLANRAVAEAYGTTVENLIGKTDADFNPKKDEVESFLCDDLDVIEGGRPKEIPEETITDWRGSVRVLHTIKIPFSMEDADCDALLGVSTDITERARAEEAARKSEERYRSIFENAVEGIFQSTPEGKFLSVNPGLASMMGYESPEEMIAAIDDIGGQQYLDPERRLKFRHLLEERGRVENFEYQIRKKDGSTGWARINARAVHGGDGRILYYEGTHENITERKKVEEDLRESEQRLSDIIQFFPDPTLVIDRDHRVTGWNLAMEELTGVTAKEMLGKGDYEYAIPFYGERRPILIDYVGCPLEEIQAKYDSVQSRGTTLSDESWVPCLAGEAVCLYGTAAALKNSRGEIVGAIESIRDVTERKRTEQRLRESEERYRTAIENSNDGVALVRGDRHIYVNRKFLDMFGYDDPGEVIGTPPDYVVHPDDGEKVMGYYVRRRRGEPVPTRYEFRGLRKDGTGIHLEVSVAAVTYKGDPASLAFMRDVTERKEAEDALTRTKNELEVWVGELERHNREGNVLRSMGDMLQTCDTESEAYLVMGRFGPDLFPGTGGALIVLHESLKTAEVTAVWGEALRSEHIFSCDDCRALRRGRLHAVTASSPGLRCRPCEGGFFGRLPGDPHHRIGKDDGPSLSGVPAGGHGSEDRGIYGYGGGSFCSFPLQPETKGNPPRAIDPGSPDGPIQPPLHGGIFRSGASSRQPCRHLRECLDARHRSLQGF